jgi:hypothetical protein
MSSSFESLKLSLNVLLHYLASQIFQTEASALVSANAVISFIIGAYLSLSLGIKLLIEQFRIRDYLHLLGGVNILDGMSMPALSAVILSNIL